MVLSLVAMQLIAQLCQTNAQYVDWSRNSSANCQIRMIKCVKATNRVNEEVSIQDCVLAGRSSYHEGDTSSQKK
jgi:hypothetical protein